jgi:CheY-specific phosphatase CheX
MPRADLQQIFLESASEVLESMFFAGLSEGEDCPQGSGALLSTKLTFHGNPSGRFGIQTAHSTGLVIAASSLGLDETEVTEAQVAEVVCELTNMICGSVLSRVEAGARFELVQPKIASENTDWRQYDQAVGSTFGLEDGTLTLWMTFEENKPALVAQCQVPLYSQTKADCTTLC